LVGYDRSLDTRHQLANVGAADALRVELSPPRQQVLASEVGSLLPRLVSLLCVLVKVSVGQLGKGAGAALCCSLGYRVASLRDRESVPGRDPPCVGETYQSDVKPSRPAK